MPHLAVLVFSSKSDDWCPHGPDKMGLITLILQVTTTSAGTRLLRQLAGLSLLFLPNFPPISIIFSGAKKGVLVCSFLSLFFSSKIFY